MQRFRFGRAGHVFDTDTVQVRHVSLIDKRSSYWVRLVEISWQPNDGHDRYGVVIHQSGDTDPAAVDTGPSVGDRRLLAGPFVFPDVQDQADVLTATISNPTSYDFRYAIGPTPQELDWSVDVVMEWLQVADPASTVVVDPFSDLTEACQDFAARRHSSVEVMLTEKAVLQRQINDFAARLETALSLLDLGEMSCIGQIARDALDNEGTGTEEHDK